MKEIERLSHFLEMAEQDAIFQVWKKDGKVYEKKCTRFLRWCPQKVREAFIGYVDCNRMMQQRILNIACQSMKFMDEED
ncbi:MAG: hypothetical protein IJ030_03870 [Oscillospiraceae bacterium]|nr:hypothetical protein [Oscillospiraceae bacterium]